MATARRAPDDLDERDVRAAAESMDLVRLAPGVWGVYHRGREHRVDLEAGACTCEDAQYNRPPAPGCKHVRRVLQALGERYPPRGVRVDSQLGRQQALYGGRDE